MTFASPAPAYDAGAQSPRHLTTENPYARRAWQFEAPAPPGDTNDCDPPGFRHQTSEKARRLQADIKRVARFPFNILITGETGTGKTMAARQVHQMSARAGRPFMELNCANLPEQLVEAELFGYRKGAFTGADRDHRGLFEEANGGTLFLDEIGDVPVAVQNKLLKAIEEKQIKRLGTNSYVQCDVQIIAATSRRLPEMIRRGEFREDLYCRLAVLTFEVAPLRERREDIPVLIDHYLREARRAVGGCPEGGAPYLIEHGAVELLCGFDYPGNIRVLRNLIYELTSYACDGEAITVEMTAAALDKVRAREARTATPDAAGSLAMPGVADASEISREVCGDSFALMNALRSIAGEGDIVLPLEVCLLRRGETFREWAARAKRCSIEATRRASGGTMSGAAERLGVTRSSLKGHLERARAAHCAAAS
jgi:transcriptional regulator with GAF, ATPase, and Fis domain